MSAAIPIEPAPARLISMDAYRGFVMICLAANGFGLLKTAGNFPQNATWQAIGYQFDHVPWVGCAFWDLIQPSFMFLVGVAMPYSYARREAAGQSPAKLFRQVLVRSLVLILLGIFLSSTGKTTTNFC
jgi:heparan-alpha-glucosaminide N-acetyltransferase